MSLSPEQQPAIDVAQEWVGGIATLPTYVSDGGESYRPAVLVWLDVATELIVGTEMSRPEEALAMAAAHLRATAQRPKAARALALPGRIRVASPELAEALRSASFEGVEVICAPTPELDRAIESLTGHLMSDDGSEPDLHYLEGDVTAAGTAAMFRAAARLYEAEPWELVPTDASLIGITSAELGLQNAVISVIGQAGQVHGFVLLASLDDFHRLGDASNRAQRGLPATYPCQLALTYERRAEVGGALLEEIAAHGWKVAGARAYPVITSLDEDAIARPPTRSEMLKIEVIATALAELVTVFPRELEESLDGERELAFDKKLASSAGVIGIEVVTPVPGHELDNALLDEDRELDDERVGAYRDALLGRFERSAEGAAQPAALPWAALLVDYASSYFGKPVEQLTAPEFRELVFEIFPRKVTTEPTSAPEIVAGLRAFMTFVGRELDGKHTGRCLASLEGDAAQQLARLLADPSKFGPAKAFMMAGANAGFDMSTRAGTDAWLEHTRKTGFRLPAGFPVPAASRREPTAKPSPPRPSKTKRKAQRAARKKNRSR